MYFGVIRKWVDARGFGFIRPAMTGPDLFFHAKGCFEANPKTGERVVYRHGWDQKKDRLLAVEVRYETIEHERRRRTGGRPATAASSAVAAGAPASSGSAARRGPSPVESDSVSESSSEEDPEDPEVQRVVLESFSQQAAPTGSGSSGSLEKAFGALDASLASTTTRRSGREDPKRRETAKAVAAAVAEVAAEAQDEAQRGRTRDRGGRRKQKRQRFRSNRGPFTHVP